MSRENPTPPDRNNGGNVRARADGDGMGPRQNTTDRDGLKGEMVSRGFMTGVAGSQGKGGASAADISRGFQRVGDPPGTPAVGDWERQGYEYDDPSRQTPTGRPEAKPFDQFDGGFLSRDPFHQHERD